MTAERRSRLRAMVLEALSRAQMQDHPIADAMIALMEGAVDGTAMRIHAQCDDVMDAVQAVLIAARQLADATARITEHLDDDTFKAWVELTEALTSLDDASADEAAS